MYRINFSTRGAYWCIQFLVFGIYWVTVKQEDGSPVTFKTFDEALGYTKERGIDRAYDRSPTRGYASAVNSGAVSYPVPQGWKLVSEEGG